MVLRLEPSSDLTAILKAACTGQLTEAQAQTLHALGPEAVTLFALAMTHHIAQLQAQASAVAAPSAVCTPSGMRPIYEKPVVDKGRRKKKPGARPGHAGARRKTPVAIDKREEHRLDACPCCGGALQKCDRVRTRWIEDIPPDIKPVVTEHTIHRDYCPSCKKHVEPVVPDAMPNATLGHQTVALSAYFHYGLGLPITPTRDLLAGVLRMEVTAGGLISAWDRMAAALSPWYEQVRQQLLSTACLHADETGWRVDGQLRWLWCFCDQSTCYYQIDDSRGGPALQKFFEGAFDGTLVSDFWSAYDAVTSGDQQKCIPHLLRELLKVDEHNDGPQWQAFAKQLRRLARDGIRLRKRHDFTPGKYRGRILLIHKRLCALADAGYADADAARLANRLSKYRDCLFTFLDKMEVPPDNNHAERQIRPAVIQRKNILCNRSDGGAHTQAVLMSIFRTLRLRGHDPTPTIAGALRTLLKTGTLPPLPSQIVAEG